MPRSNGRRGEYLLYESNLRKMLTNMYNALRTTANSCSIMQKTPDKIGRGEYSGDELAQNSMEGLCRWLSGISALAKDDAAYRAAFLEPVRAAAKMRLKLSRMKTRSDSFDALVFAQMPHYDKEYKTQRIIMSAVVPGLQAPMSVRVSAESKDLRGHGYRVLEKCQPVPLANRIHQTGGQVRRSERRIRLSEFDFLYTALEDIRSLGRSLEMENFCEVPFVGAETRQRLAAPFVTFGKIETVSGPAVYVKSLDGEHLVKMAVENQIAELSGAPHLDFERKTARLLGAQWYEPDRDPNSVPEDPALYCIEADGDLGALRLQEACGRVRLRGSIPAGEIPEGMRGRLSELPCISAEKGSVEYARRGARGEVGTHFLEAHGGICRARKKINAVQITEEQVIDRRKSSVGGLAGVLVSRRCRALGALLTDFVMQADARSEYSEEAAARSLGMEPVRYGRKMARLRSFGLVEKTEGWSLTGKGRDVAKEICKRKAGRIPKEGLPAVLSPDSLTDRGIPPSLALFLLRSGALGGYRQARTGGRTTEVYWTVQRREAEAGDLACMLGDFERRILKAMGEVSHSSTAAGIAESAGASAFTTELLLSEMSTVPDSPVRRDGGSWEYTVEARVLDLFEREKRKIMSEDDVTDRIGVGTVRREEVRGALESLVRAGAVARIQEGMFSHSSDLESKRGEQMDRVAKKAAVDALASQDGMDDGQMIDALVKILGEAGMQGEMDRLECARRTLNRMEDEGLICRNGSRILRPA